MKAGIYETPKGSLIYVRKDRSIAAMRQAGADATTEIVGDTVKVSVREKERLALCDAMYLGAAERVADVPNGCNDACAAVDDYATARETVEEYRDPYEAVAQAFYSKPQRDLVDAAVVQGATYTGVSGSPDFLLDPERRYAVISTDDAGYRICHAKSARKHRKQGHEVKYVLELQAYAWRKAS